MASLPIPQGAQLVPLNQGGSVPIPQGATLQPLNVGASQGPSDDDRSQIAGAMARMPQSDTTPLNQQGAMRRFFERALGIPDRVFDHPGEYLNVFSRSYWNPSPQVQADRASMVPSGKMPSPSEMIPGRQTVADIKAGNLAGAAGDVLPDALAVAQMAVPAAGKVIQMPGVSKVLPRAGRYVGAGVGYKTAGPVGAAVGGIGGEIASRALTKAAPWMARSVGVGTGEVAQAPEATPAQPAQPTPPAQVQQQPVAQETPQAQSTPPQQSAKEWLDNLLKGGTQQASAPAEAPSDLNQYYGKTRQIGMPTPHELLKPHERQMESPTFSTAPGQNPSTPQPTYSTQPIQGSNGLQEVRMNVGGAQRGSILLRPAASGSGLPANTFEIRSSMIAPELQGKGLGSELYAKAAESAKASGADFLASDTELSPQAAQVWQSIAAKDPRVSQLDNGRYVMDLRDAQSTNTEHAGTGGFTVPQDIRTYHGTSAQFEKFDPALMGEGAKGDLYGKGIYLSDNPEVAQGYSTKGETNIVRQQRIPAGTRLLDADKLSISDVERIVNSANESGPLAGLAKSPHTQLMMKMIHRGEIRPENLNLQDLAKSLSDQGNQYLKTAGKTIDENTAKDAVWEAVKNAGYDGVRYQAGKYMGRPMSGYNYVLYDTDIINNPRGRTVAITPAAQSTTTGAAKPKLPFSLGDMKNYYTGTLSDLLQKAVGK